MPLLAPLPSLAAYRSDLSALDASDVERGAEWAAVAACIEGLPGLDEAALDRALPALAALLRAHDALTLQSLSPRVRALAAQAEDAGALRLAHTIAARWREFAGLSVDERGRTLALEGRVLRQLDAREQSAERYAEVERLGRRHARPELRARASVGRAVLAQLRGNYPEMRERFREALAQATEAEEWTLVAQAHQGLMIAASAAGDHDEALAHAWRSFRLAERDDASAAEALVNLGQLLASLGHPAPALTAFATAVSRRPPLRLDLPATSGAAAMAAILGEARLVRALAARVERLVASTEGFAYVRDCALLEIAGALHGIGDATRARGLAERALQLATERGYHELALRAAELGEATRESCSAAVAPVAFSAASADILDHVSALADPHAVLAGV